ncbi:hypothetical protein HZA86_05660 [Candidatus Uhrbacteria bacterium]|nr:hypothetical protein [Candidatus Uhrbacteria bacterium]
MDESTSLKLAGLSLKYGPKLPRMLIGITLGLCGILLLWRSIALGNATRSLSAVHSTNLKAATDRFVNGFSWSHESLAPASISLDPVEALTAGSGVQWVSAITNPNPEWIARVRLHFISETVNPAARVVTVLPHTTLPIIEGGVPLASGGEQVQLVVDDIRWQRWSSVPEYLRWDESPFKLLSAVPGTDIKTPTLTMRIQNQGALGYKDVLLLLRWEEGKRVNGAIVVPLESIGSQEIREIQLRVDHLIPGYAQFFLDPIFDPTDLLHVG